MYLAFKLKLSGVSGSELRIRRVSGLKAPTSVSGSSCLTSKSEDGENYDLGILESWTQNVHIYIYTIYNIGYIHCNILTELVKRIITAKTIEIKQRTCVTASLVL